jgi:hypothetical protein
MKKTKNRLTFLGFVYVTCPYCGYNNRIDPAAYDLKDARLSFVSCDCDEGVGCGETFAVRPMLKCSTTSYRLEEAK